jgi:NAD(P)-dependent dehydrogenase (short-subunit alcohol dehydrogenase family)
MLGKGYGRIVNIASVAGKEGNPNAPAYSASKAGVIGLTRSLGKELPKSGITVNCVAPGLRRMSKNRGRQRKIVFFSYLPNYWQRTHERVVPCRGFLISQKQQNSQLKQWSLQNTWLTESSRKTKTFTAVAAR